MSRLFLLLGALTLVLAVDVPLRGQDRMKVPPVMSLFDLRDVALLDGPFKHAMEKDQAYILTLKPDRLLARVREYAGLAPRDSMYGGWEREGLASHSVGHYLSACALQYRGSGNVQFLDRVRYVVDELDSCQQANGNGYVGGMPDGKRVFAEVATGTIRSKGFDLNGLWSPWYTIHKIMAGLRDAFLLCKADRALSVLVGMAEWAYATTKDLDDAQFQRMLDCEYGGMNEILADVYALTGQEKYLFLAKKFHHRAVEDPIARGEDRLQGLHGNTQIPKFIGAARLYELTGEPQFAAMSAFFWETVTRNHTYAAGGHGENEYFGAPGRLSDRLSEGTMETCNTYNMLKLTRFLMTRDPRSSYADFYERALTNHILASQNPDDGMVCYFVPLGSGSYKRYSTPTEDFTCCLGTGMENHSRYTECIYAHRAESLYVNLFIPSAITWRDKGIRARLTTDLPSSGAAIMALTCARPVRITVKIRHPSWAEGNIRIAVNGIPVPGQRDARGYISVERTWRTNDTLQVELPLSLRLEPMPDNPRRVALMYGPVLLAGDLGPITEPVRIPVLVTNGRRVSDWVTAVSSRPLTFRTSAVGRPADVTLIPFSAMHHRRYAVYWDIYGEAEWREVENAVRAEDARLHDLEARTVDVMRAGEMQPERDHGFQGDKTTVGDYRERKWRLATDGGWFSYEMRVPEDVPADLVVTYWGSDAGKKEFDITVDDERIATVILERNRPDQFFDATYPIPLSLTKGKSKVRIGFRPHRTMVAGRVFGCRIVRGRQTGE